MNEPLLEGENRPPCPYEGKVPGPYGPLPEAGGTDAPPKPLPALVPPPRSVPLAVRVGNLFGGFFNQFAWLWLGLTGAFAWFFLGNADLAGLYHFRRPLGRAQGVVTASRGTNFKENDVRVYAHVFRFEGPDGRAYTGTSYATGRRLKKGTRVAVEFVRDDPSIARIVGMRRAEFGIEGWGGVFVLGLLGTFTAVGVGMLAKGVHKGLKANRLLATGLPALGRLKARRPTNTSVNDRTVWEFTFEFRTEDGQTCEAKARTHQVDRLSDPRGEYLLYDPARPAEAVFLDEIPGPVRIDEFGALEATSPLRSLLSLGLPALVLAGHGTAAWLILG